MFFVYEVLLYLVAIVLLPWFVVVGFLRGKYLANFPQRFGSYDTEPGPYDLWVHAVSVGEVMVASSIIRLLQSRRPAIRIVVTTTTITGQATARRVLRGAEITYFPFDFSFSVGRFVSHHKPRVFVAVETEIWPNVSRIASASGTKLAIANGRISDRSFPRYRSVRKLLRPILRRYSAILVREPLDRDRAIAIGAPEEIVEIVGNVKFDFDLDESHSPIESALVAMARGRPIAILGSTVEGEDEILLPAILTLIGERTFVVVAPRKPERFDLVAGLLMTSSVRFCRRSELDPESPPECDLVLLDTIGELAKTYRVASLAFVGGSLVRLGGHNPIEPAAAGIPVAFGPHMSNFRDIAETFVRGGGASVVHSPEEFLDFARAMLRDPDRRRKTGEAARATLEANRGAALRTVEKIEELLG